MRKNSLPILFALTLPLAIIINLVDLATGSAVAAQGVNAIERIGAATVISFQPVDVLDDKGNPTGERILFSPNLNEDICVTQIIKSSNGYLARIATQRFGENFDRKDSFRSIYIDSRSLRKNPYSDICFDAPSDAPGVAAAIESQKNFISEREQGARIGAAKFTNEYFNSKSSVEINRAFVWGDAEREDKMLAIGPNVDLCVTNLGKGMAKPSIRIEWPGNGTVFLHGPYAQYLQPNPSSDACRRAPKSAPGVVEAIAATEKLAKEQSQLEAKRSLIESRAAEERDKIAAHEQMRQATFRRTPAGRRQCVVQCENNKGTCKSQNVAEGYMGLAEGGANIGGLALGGLRMKNCEAEEHQCNVQCMQ